MLLACDKTLNPRCNQNQTKATEYLGEVQLTLLMNTLSLNLLEFGDNTLNKRSEFKNVQFDKNKPNFIHSEIKLASVQDQ